MAIEAICADCGKTWKVPDASRIYKCKQCGGRVAVAEEAPAAAPEPAPAPTTAEVRRAKTVQHSTIAPLPPETKPPKKRAAGGAGRKKLLIVGGAVVVSVGVLIGIIIASQGPSFEDRMDEFAKVWESGSTDDLKRWFQPAYVQHKWDAEMAEIFDKRGWENSRPSLTGRVIADETGNSASVDFNIGSGVFQTRWLKERSRWGIVKIQVPKYKEADDPPSANAKQALKAAVEQFRAVWNGKRYTDVGEMVHEKAAPAVKTALQFNGKKYESRLPLVEGPDITFTTRALVVVKFQGVGGDFKTVWKAVGGTWTLWSYVFPKTGS